jgi:hypothetical protein
MVSGQLHAPAALPSGKEIPFTHWIGGWVGPRIVLDAEVKRKSREVKWLMHVSSVVRAVVWQNFLNT